MITSYSYNNIHHRPPFELSPPTFVPKDPPDHGIELSFDLDDEDLIYDYSAAPFSSASSSSTSPETPETLLFDQDSDTEVDNPKIPVDEDYESSVCDETCVFRNADKVVSGYGRPQINPPKRRNLSPRRKDEYYQRHPRHHNQERGRSVTAKHITAFNYNTPPRPLPPVLTR